MAFCEINDYRTISAFVTSGGFGKFLGAVT